MDISTTSSVLRVCLACAGLATLVGLADWLRGLGLIASDMAIAAFGLAAALTWVPVTWALVIRPIRGSAAHHRRRFDAMLETAPDAVVAVDGRGTIALANEQAHALFGYPSGELVGLPLDDLVPDRFRERHAALRQEYEQAPRPRRMGAKGDLTGLRRDGTEFPVDISLSFMPSPTGSLTLAFIRDVSATRALWNEVSAARAEAEAEVRERRRLRAISELVQSLRSRDEVRSVLNLHLEHLFPGTSGAILTLDPARERTDPLVDWGPDATAGSRVAAEDCWALRLGKPYGLDEEQDSIPCPHVGAEARARDYVCVPMMADGETLGVFHVRAGRAANQVRGALDAPARRRACNVADRLALPLANIRLREMLHEQSYRDGLTGVFNRRFMEDALAREISRATRQAGAIAVAMLDLDHFKRLNDDFGHDMGDEVLRSFGRFLTSRLRDSDLVCRYGGEEFIVICGDASSDHATPRLDAIREQWALARIRDRRGRFTSATFSAGVSAFPRDGATADDLVRAADTALYRAKSLGRNCVVDFNVLDPRPSLSSGSA